ncbi:MAG: hypothetical protein ACOC35_00270 [Promethearchaeia archaeon]
MIYQVKGESLINSPGKLLRENAVYLIVDKNLKTFWIWAGKNSRLFHRYIASTWVGKLKSQKKYYNFEKEIIKENREPGEFLVIKEEINEKSSDLEFPGQSRKQWTKDSREKVIKQSSVSSHISEKEINTIENILSEIKEMHMHMKYSFNHIDKRIKKIRDILNK